MEYMIIKFTYMALIFSNVISEFCQPQFDHSDASKIASTNQCYRVVYKTCPS